MSWELFGNLVLVVMILATPIIFAVANANYLPEVEGGEDEDGTEEKTHS